MTTRKRKRTEAKYRGQWEYRYRIGKQQVIYLGGSRRFNQQTRRIFGNGFARPAYSPLIHNGGRP